MNGCLDITGIVYFLTIIALCLFLTCQVVQKRRFSFSAKKIGTSVFSVGTIVIAVAVAVVVNLVINELPSTVTSIDATSTKLYSLTDDTKTYLKLLDEDVTIYVLVSEDSADTTVQETLKRYEDLSSHISVVYKDPNLYPNFYSQYTDSTPSTGDLIVVSGDRSRVVSYNDLYETEFDYSTYSQNVTGYDAEGQITSAIQFVSMDASELPVIYEVTGHGETNLDGGFSEAVEKANITLSDLTLLKEDAVPEDASAIIINCPTSDFSSDDADKVIAYLDNGGKAIIITDFEYKGLTNFEKILDAYGVSRVDGIVAENDSNYYYNNNPFYILPNVASTSYTTSVAGKYIFAPYAEAFSYDTANEDVTYTELLSTTDSAVSKTDSANATTTEYEEGDVSGPFTLALAVEKGDMKLVVAGSCVLFTDSADSIVSGANASMFTDTLSELVGDESIASSVIPVKEYSLSTITITSIHTIIAGLAAAVVLPILLLLAGIIIWAARRKK
jgi:ABC-2 type transport system permease protein